MVQSWGDMIYHVNPLRKSCIFSLSLFLLEWFVKSMMDMFNHLSGLFKSGWREVRTVYKILLNKSGFLGIQAWPHSFSVLGSVGTLAKLTLLGRWWYTHPHIYVSIHESVFRIHPFAHWFFSQFKVHKVFARNQIILQK